MRHYSTSNTQRKLAAKVLKCGVNRVWMNPAAVSRISKAITRSDIKGLIADRVIRKLPEKKKTKNTYKKQRTGSRKGRKGAREGKKSNWFRIIRPQRRLLMQYRKEGKLKPLVYRKLYKLVKGGSFRNKAHLNTYLNDKNMLIKEEK